MSDSDKADLEERLSTVEQQLDIMIGATKAFADLLELVGKQISQLEKWFQNHLKPKGPLR